MKRKHLIYIFSPLLLRCPQHKCPGLLKYTMLYKSELTGKLFRWLKVYLTNENLFSKAKVILFQIFTVNCINLLTQCLAYDWSFNIDKTG